MSRVVVENTLQTREDDYGNEPETVMIKSHWNDNDLVCLIICGKTYTLSAAAIQTAVENATRTG